ncbi:MAG: TonB-dependent receptor, partial [Bacteroidota bacterium]
LTDSLGFMHLKRLRLLALWAGICSTQLLAQVRQVDTVDIQTYAFSEAELGKHLHELDSAEIALGRGQSLAAVLAQHSQVFVKSYGPTGLASSSIRGGGASHTAILWNGFNLQSPLNGQLDLNLIPAFFVDRAAVQYGGNGSWQGSGSMGGALLLASQPRLQDGPSLSIHGLGGSFGQRQVGGELAWGGKKWALRSRAYSLQATNNFPILGREKRQTHASLTSSGLSTEGLWQLGAKQKIQAWYWRQASLRQLPPTLSQDSSAATQRDQSQRMAAAWTYQGLRYRLRWRSAWLSESLRFQDPLSDLDALSSAQQLLNQWELDLYPAARHRLHLALHQGWQRGRAQNLELAQAQRHTLSLLSSYQYLSQNQNWRSKLALRQEWIDGTWVPVTPSLGTEYRIWPQLILSGQINRSYRVPTFNDLYWNPGGNPDLKPEQGWGQELGLQGQHITGRQVWAWRLGFYHQAVQNWILWLPSGRGYWTPQNVRRVRSLGMESELSYQTSGTWGELRLNLRHHYTQARVLESAQARDASVGKQLIYVPLHQGQSQAIYQKGKLRAEYLHQWIGRRFTTSDQSFSLPAYQLGSGSLAYQVAGKHLSGQIFFRIDNLWNRNYQVLEDRPMPGRAFQIGVDLTINPQLHNKS